jgi:rfaE bifunctional protein kinase chain/domain/rfaE bifunctional protein nucleotidyltransferase chain/domain
MTSNTPSSHSEDGAAANGFPLGNFSFGAEPASVGPIAGARSEHVRSFSTDGHSTGPTDAKILLIEQLLAKRAAAKAAGRRVVHCHGCFDIVHPGHLRHLRHAKAQGDILLVTITGDSLINKGTGRPLIPQELRAENLAALDCVDWVYVESRPTAVELLEQVRPDIYVKGREYEQNKDARFKAEQDTVIRHGGRVVFSSGDVVFSSTALIAALEQSVDPYHARLRTLLETPELDGERVSRVIGSFRSKRVLVIGEVIRDTYVLCDRPDVAGESPIMTLRPVERRTYDGGAAVIARHLAAMGALPVLITALDDSDETQQLRQRLLADGVELRTVKVERPLPEKQRFLVGQQKIMKLDLVQRLEPDAGKQHEFAGVVADTLTENGAFGVDATILADFGLGLITSSLLGQLCPLIRTKSGVVSGDVSGRRSNLTMMRDMDLLCPSESEARDAYRQYDQSLSTVVYRMMHETRSKNAIVTMGSEGLVTFDRLPGFGDVNASWGTKMKSEHVPALSGTAIDPLGCGDALISAATLALTADASLLTAGFLGAIAAGIQVQRLGNTVISATDLRHGVSRLHSAHLAYAPADVVQSRSPLGTRVHGVTATSPVGVSA